MKTDITMTTNAWLPSGSHRPHFDFRTVRNLWPWKWGCAATVLSSPWTIWMNGQPISRWALKIFPCHDEFAIDADNFETNGKLCSAASPPLEEK